MASEPRLIQLARILGEKPEALDDSSAARFKIENYADALATAFFHEAADSDDVVSVESAIDYLDGRVAYFGDLVSDLAEQRIRARFRFLVSQWER